MPKSLTTWPAFSAATCAAKGVLLREPLNLQPPDVAQDKALPCLSVIVIIVLLNDAWTCATPSTTFFLTRLRCRAGEFAAISLPLYLIILRGPLRVLAFVFVL